MAVAAGNPVYIVGQFDGTVLDCSIWKRIELSTLVAGNIHITLVDYSNFDKKRDYPGTTPIITIPPRSEGNALDELEKRETEYCFDWPGTGEDPNDPDADSSAGIPYYPGNCGVHLTQVSPSLFRGLMI